MAEDQQDLSLEEVGAGAEEAEGRRGAGLFSGLVLAILKWAAIGVGFVILGVTTTVITFNLINRGRAASNLASLSPEYQGKAEPLAYYDLPDSIRGVTSDETPAIFMARLSIGYEKNAKNVNAELIERTREIQGFIFTYLSSKKANELSADHYNEILEEVRLQINRVMRTGKVRAVVFREFVLTK